MAFEDPAKILNELRRQADTIHLEPIFNELMWLKQIPGGLTDCCPAANPCDYHATLTNEAPKATQ